MWGKLLEFLNHFSLFLTLFLDIIIIIIIIIGVVIVVFMEKVLMDVNSKLTGS